MQLQCPEVLSSAFEEKSEIISDVLHTNMLMLWSLIGTIWDSSYEVSMEQEKKNYLDIIFQNKIWASVKEKLKEQPIRDTLLLCTTREDNCR